MFAAANPTLDLLILELALERVGLAAFLLGLFGLRLPVHARSENEVLAHRCRVKRGTRRVTLFQAEFRPRLSFCDCGVDVFLDHGRADLARGLHLLAVIIKAVSHHRLRAVLIRRYLLRWKRRGLIKLLVVRPVRATAEMIPLATRKKKKGANHFESIYPMKPTHFATRDIL